MDDAAFEPFKGHTRDINTLVYSPDGAFIATGSDDRTIRIWEVKTGRQVGEPLEGRTNWILAIAYSPDGKRLVSGSVDGTLRVWDTSTHQTVMGPLEGHTDWVRAVQYSPDGALIASGGRDSLLKLWNAHGGDCIATLQHPDYVNSVSFSPNSKHIATACNDRLVRIYDVDQHQLVRELAGHRARVRCVQYSPDSSLIASASNDYTIRLWDASTGDLVKEPLRGHRYFVSGISFSYDSQQLVSSSQDESVRAWDVTSGECILGPLYGHKERIMSVSCSPNQHHFASWSENEVRIWDLNDGSSALPQVESVTESNTDIINEYSTKAYGAVRAVAWFSDGKHFASAGVDHAIRIYDSQTGQESTGPLVGHDGGVNGIDISRNNELLASAANDGLVCVWDLKTGDLALEPLSGHDGAVLAVRFILDDTRLVTGGNDDTIRTWDVQSGASLHVIQAHSDWVRALSISPDGSRFASGSDDNTVCTWDIHSCEMLGKPLKCEREILSVCYSPDGSQLLTGSGDRMICLWNVSRGEKVAVFKHEGWVRCVQFSRDGSKILSASEDKKVCVWDAGTGKLLHAWLHDDWVYAAAFSPDGDRVVGGSDNGDLYMWNVKTGQLLLPKRLVDPKRSIEAGDLEFVADETPEGEPPEDEPPEDGALETRNSTVFTRVFRRFFRNNANGGLQMESSSFSPFVDGGDVDQGNSENVSERIDGPSQERQITQPSSNQERSGNVEATGGDKGKAREQRLNSPVSQSTDSLGSFMNRPAVVINKNNGQGVNGFFDDVETNDSTQQLRHAEESSQQDAQDLRRRIVSDSITRTFAWMRQHLPGRRAETDIDPCVPTNVAPNVATRSRLINATSMLRQAVNRVSRFRGNDAGREQESEPQSYPLATFRRHTSRRTVIVSPAWANLRIFASGDTPGRRPGGSTQPVENDVDDDDTDSMSSEESYGPVVDALCFCRCSRLFGRRRAASRSTRRQTGSSFALEQMSTNNTSAPGQPNPTPTQSQEESASAPLQGDEPVTIQPHSVRMQPKVSSAGGHAQSSSGCVQTTGSE